MERERPLQSVPDDELLSRLADLLRQSRHDEAELVAHIGEVDARRLYARAASPSMFAYCTEVLHLSEAEAYLRIAAARAARAHPVLLTMLRDGRLHLTGIAKLAPHLTAENASTLLLRATHKSKVQILELLAEVAPRQDAPTVVRRLPERGPVRGGAGTSGLIREEQPTVGPTQGSANAQGSRVGASASGLRPDQVPSHPPATPPPSMVEPLAPGRYRIQFTAGGSFLDKLKRLQALMRSRPGDADLATILEAAVTEKLQRLEAKRFAQTKAPREALPDARITPASRHVPAAVRRAVFARDGRRCSYLDERGRRCTERKRLEFHHRYPFGRGGDHSPGNIGLVCPAHNAFLAAHDYGREHMARYRGSRCGPRPPDVATIPSGTARTRAVPETPCT